MGVGVAGERRAFAMKVGGFANSVLIFLMVFSVLLLLLLRGRGVPFMFGLGLPRLGGDFGFVALALIAATGVLMLFKSYLVKWMGSPDAVWRLHIIIAGAGGVFLGLHVVVSLAYPLTPPIFLGYLGTGGALFVWLTGGVYFQGLRNSMFYHGLLSIGAIFLMVLHTFDAGRNIPMEVSGISLALAAVLVLAGVAVRLASAWKAATPSP